MLKRFALRNYRNFKDPIVIDFSNVGGYQFNQDCITNGMLGKMLMYGRNATGKTNFGRAINDLKRMTIYPGAALTALSGNSNFLNADSQLDFAEFDYLFRFGTTELRYVYRRDAIHLKSERLTVDDQTIFDFDYIGGLFSCEGLKRIGAETIRVDLFLATLQSKEIYDGEEVSATPSFLRWLLNNAAFAEDSLINSLRKYIGSMAIASSSVLQNRPSPRRNSAFFEGLEGDSLRSLENFLNAMGVPCALVSERLPDGSLELYFQHKRPVPFFENASSGTMVLFNLYRNLISRMETFSFLCLDEFDAFFHFEMSERFLRYLKETFPYCQIILTTHNTNLMTNRLMRPDCIFILTQAGQLTPLNQATPRELREGHNLEKLYMSGEFDE